jgi:DNA-binding HxlR family transcriptional regulator
VELFLVLLLIFVWRTSDILFEQPAEMLRILEEKGLIVRSLGSEDRRQMYFHLTQLGKQRVTELELDKVEIPDLLKPLF